MDVLCENIYGHAKRLGWIISHLDLKDTVVELGCGTGFMISLPLIRRGYNVMGIDLDKESVAYGQKVFRLEGYDPNRLKAMDIADLNVRADAVIASEVIEHIPDHGLVPTLQVIREKLKAGGKLLVTVPNGYGWFELESFLWYKTGLSPLLEKVFRRVRKLKGRMVADQEYPHPSTLADSPHLQRFTYDTIRKLLRAGGFEVIEATASVLVSGPFSNAFFTGIKPIMKWNSILGNRLPRIASSFFIACKLL